MNNNYNYDLIVIGADPGGYVAATRARKLGLKTAIVEKETWGGVCFWMLVVFQQKLYLKNAKVYHYFDVSSKYGISYDKNSLKIDWSSAQQRKTGVVNQLINDVKFLMKANKVDTIIGTAKAVDRNTLLK